MLDRSLFRVVSIGIVAENKRRGTDEVEIHPVELLPGLKDELSVGRKILQSVGLDKDDNPYKVEIELSACIRATWLGDEHRITSPDVRRGETVFLYQAADADEYYWETRGRNLDLRRLETIVWAFSGNPDNADHEITNESHYMFEINTHEKHVTFRTSQMNGEYTIYTAQFNTAEGKFVVEDSHGNYGFIDTAETHIKFRNADDTIVELDKGVVHIKCDHMQIDTNTYERVAPGGSLVKGHQRITSVLKAGAVTAPTIAGDSVHAGHPHLLGGGSGAVSYPG